MGDNGWDGEGEAISGPEWLLVGCAACMLLQVAPAGWPCRKALPLKTCIGCLTPPRLPVKPMHCEALRLWTMTGDHALLPFRCHHTASTLVLNLRNSHR